MSPASVAIDAVMRSVENGLAIEAAARILKREADAADQHPKLAGMLRICAEGLKTHPEPRMLCSRNFDRLNLEVRMGNVERWPKGMVATQIAAAADAFERAADLLGKERVTETGEQP